MKKLYLLLQIFISFTIVSCNSVEESPFQKELKQAISNKYDTEKLEVNVNSKNAISVIIKDSKFEELNDKAQMSFEIGDIVNKLKDENYEFSDGQVMFVFENSSGLIKTKKSATYKMFK